MDIRNRIRERAEQHGASEAHVACQTNQTNIALRQLLENGSIVVVSYVPSSMITIASMPDRRARSRPAASGRFEITTTIAASRPPLRVASISARRLLPRPEIGLPVGDEDQRSPFQGRLT